MRINAQYRICFQFEKGNASNVFCDDIHYENDMLPTNRISTHPGIILLQEFIEPAGLTQAKVAKTLRISVNRLSQLVRGRRGVTPDTAWKLSALFKTSPEFWMNLQSTYDLTKTRPRRRVA